MPRYKVLKRMPAIYEEVHFVDASSPDEARVRADGGRSRCSWRSFHSVQGERPAARIPTTVLHELEGSTFENIAGEVDPALLDLGQEFCNGRFVHPAGADHQLVVQVFHE